MFRSWCRFVSVGLICWLTAVSFVAAQAVEDAEMAGYLLVPNERVDSAYNGGFSMYVSAWPLLHQYPGNRFQTGLFGTWMHAQYDSPRSKEEKLYSILITLNSSNSLMSHGKISQMKKRIVLLEQIVNKRIESLSI